MASSKRDNPASPNQNQKEKQKMKIKDHHKIIDHHGYVVIDTAGEIMGSGYAEWLAVEYAARNLDMTAWAIDDLIQSNDCEESLMIRTRAEWEATSGMTVEQYLGRELEVPA